MEHATLNVSCEIAEAAGFLARQVAVPSLLSKKTTSRRQRFLHQQATLRHPLPAIHPRKCVLPAKPTHSKRLKRRRKPSLKPSPKKSLKKSLNQNLKLSPKLSRTPSRTPLPSPPWPHRNPPYRASNGPKPWTWRCSRRCWRPREPAR